MARTSRINEQRLRETVPCCFSYAQVLKALGLSPKGGNYSTLKRKLKLFQIDTSHFTGQGWNIGLGFKPNPSRPLDEILIENSSYQPFKLKNRLLKEGLKEHQCESCHLKLWLDKPIPLELHHVNGVKNDNRIENLMILCPNCHAQTDNYRAKNIGTTI